MQADERSQNNQKICSKVLPAIGHRFKTSFSDLVFAALFRRLFIKKIFCPISDAPACFFMRNFMCCVRTRNRACSGHTTGHDEDTQLSRMNTRNYAN